MPRFISTVACCKFQNHRFQGKIYSHWSKCSRWRPEVQTSYLVSPGQLYGRPEEDIKRIIIYSMWHLQYMRSFRGEFIIMCHNHRSPRAIYCFTLFILSVYSTMFPIGLCNPLAANFCFVNSAIHLIPKAWSEHGVEALWTGQNNIILSCPQCLDSMLAPGFWNWVHSSNYPHFQSSAVTEIVPFTSHHSKGQVPNLIVIIDSTLPVCAYNKMKKCQYL